MLGWLVAVYPTGVGLEEVAPQKVRHDIRPIARWVAGVAGLDWVDELCSEGGGVFLGGDGYPFRYAMHANRIKPLLLKTPTQLHRCEFVNSTVPLSGGEGLRCPEEIAAVPDSQWVLIQAFDRS